MESFKKLFKRTQYVSILYSIILALIGIILILNPNITLHIISWTLGLLFIFAGIYKIVGYFVSKSEGILYNYSLIYGFTAIIIGIVAIVYMNVIGSMFRIIIGLWIIYMSFVGTDSALQIKKNGNKSWLYTIVLSILMLICGLYIIFSSGAIIVAIGIIMLICSIINIIENIIIMKYLN